MNIDTRPVMMPDIALQERSFIATPLDWVGMTDLALPVRIHDSTQGITDCHARANIHVDLARADSKGIHMSRLFLLLEDAVRDQALTPPLVHELLQQMLDSHADISSSASVSLAFDFYARRAALLSDNSGWKAYPAEISGVLKNGRLVLGLKLDVAYSSTCPCSASLSRQLLENAFQQDFPDDAPLSRTAVSRWLLENGSLATPHSQRSYARVELELAALDSFPVLSLIDDIEAALQTPVQAAVKREDEQAFARLNGANLMFCEDAARRIKQQLSRDLRIADFHLKVEHQESLHAHNAVAVAIKGVAGGLRA